MAFRRLPRFTLLAVASAAALHVAVFGFEHAPGGGHAALFATGLGAGLALCALLVFLSAALDRSRRELGLTTPSRHAFGRMLRLAASALAAYGLIEVLEGHAFLGGALRALAFVLPVAACVAGLARSLAGVTRAAGGRLAAFAASLRDNPAAAFARRYPVPAQTRTRALVSRRSGRAPPAFA